MRARNNDWYDIEHDEIKLGIDVKDPLDDKWKYYVEDKNSGVWFAKNEDERKEKKRELRKLVNK